MSVHIEAPLVVAVVHVFELVEASECHDQGCGGDQPAPGGPVQDRRDEPLLAALSIRAITQEHSGGRRHNHAVRERAQRDADAFGRALQRLAEAIWVEHRLVDEPQNVSARCRRRWRR